MKQITILTLFLICNNIYSQAQTDTLYVKAYIDSSGWQTINPDTIYDIKDFVYDSTYWGQVGEQLIDPHEIILNPINLHGYKFGNKIINPIQQNSFIITTPSTALTIKWTKDSLFIQTDLKMDEAAQFFFDEVVCKNSETINDLKQQIAILEEKLKQK